MADDIVIFLLEVLFFEDFDFLLDFFAIGFLLLDDLFELFLPLRFDALDFFRPLEGDFRLRPLDLLGSSIPLPSTASLLLFSLTSGSTAGAGSSAGLDMVTVGRQDIK